jgi:hypothetical protein
MVALSRRSHNQSRPSSGQTRNNHRSALIRHNCHTGGTPGTEPKVFKISPYGSRLLCLSRTAGHVKQKQPPVAQIAKGLVTKRISALCYSMLLSAMENTRCRSRWEVVRQRKSQEC